MTKRQYLVTIEGEETPGIGPEHIKALVNMALIDGGAQVVELDLANQGLYVIPHPLPGAIAVFQADQREPVEYINPPRDYGPTPEEWDRLRGHLENMGNPYGHIEVLQEDGTYRRPEPGEILTSEGLQHGFNYPERFIVETSNGDVIGRFRTREQADTVADRWNQQDTINEVYPATVRDLREDTTNEN